MSSLLQDIQVPYLTISEYVKMEEQSTEKLEYWNGKIKKVTGGSPEHNLICGNIIGEFKILFRELQQHFLVYTSDQKLLIPDFDLYVYPDAVVITEKPEISDIETHALLNPLLIVEVLSSSTENYDLGSKFIMYKTIPSFREYIAISQDKPWVLSSYKRDDGLWEDTIVQNVNADINLRSVGIQMALKYIYADIKF